jgi:hypothetical protein
MALSLGARRRDDKAHDQTVEGGGIRTANLAIATEATMMGTKESHERTILEGFPLVVERLQMQDGVTILDFLSEVYREGTPEYDDMRESLSFLCGLKPALAPTAQQVETAFTNWTEEAPRRIKRVGTGEGGALWAIGGQA